MHIVTFFFQRLRKYNQIHDMTIIDHSIMKHNKWFTSGFVLTREVQYSSLNSHVKARGHLDLFFSKFIGGFAEIYMTIAKYHLITTYPQLYIQLVNRPHFGI